MFPSPEITSLIRSLRKELSAIGERLGAIQEMAKGYLSAVSAAEEARHNKQQQETKVSAEIRFTQEAEKKRDEEHKQQLSIQIVVAATTAITALAAIVYATIAAYQLNEIRQSNNINREALVSVQRAFVNIGKNMQDNPIIVPGHAGIQGWEFRPRVANSGVTPTRNAESHANFVLWLGPLPENFPFPDLGQLAETPFVLGPKEDTTGPLLTLSSAQVRQVRERKALLYFYGWISYQDIFPETPRHVSMFCIQLTEIRGELKPNTSYQFLWALCPRHNCADDECRGEPYGTPTRVWQ